MCGIAGIVSSGRINGELLSRMINIQSHRGPDGEGVWISPDGQVALGHRRLAIIDLSDGARQPMIDISGRYVITYNGEIYNYIELREELKKLGASFRSQSDTEVLLEAYKYWGINCLERLNGMFAFAIYDQTEQKLFCARDRYGEKPFLFAKVKDFFAFASEYKALLTLPDIPPDYDEIRLLLGLYNASFGLDSDNDTVFKAIKQLKPSEAMIVDTGNMECKIWRYWDVYPNEDYAKLTEMEAIELFRELLIDSVRIRLRSDVPVGSCLSGGLDSSAIVSIVKKCLLPQTPYHCFTGRFPGTHADEWEYAQEVVKGDGIISHVTEPTAEKFVEELPDFIWFNELPVGSSSQYAQWCVFRLAKENGVTVLLDGQGGDELLGGYEQYFKVYVESLKEAGEYKRLDRELPEIRKRYPLALAPPVRALRDRLPFFLRHYVARKLGKGSNFLFGLRRDVAEKLRNEVLRERDPRFSPLCSALYKDSFGRYLTTLLRYGDRNSMAHSREVRLPFCDHRLAELVFSLPPHYLMGEVQTKRLLREAMRGILPEKIRTRWNKRGFLPPQDLWFSGPLFDLAKDVIESRSFTQSGIWEISWWRKVLKRIQKKESNLGWVLWQPLMFEAWRKYFLVHFR
ncbi:MAG: asparagine synthase (glutamine-hydrolyzing) [Deltaproteobacteria bacterium]|nr:asparagine synthase (glutamine-hydrolyzing) [Deltaproteobacteria bacterium]